MPGNETQPRATPPAARFYPVEYPLAPDFHPEFGYLCPSASLLRKLRHGALTAVVGLAMAASVTVALAPRAATHGGGPPAPAVPALAPSAALEAAAPAVAGAPAAPPKHEGPAAQARAQVNCDDFLASFRAAPCRGKPRWARTTRAQPQELATVAIGRAGAELDPQAAAGTSTAAAAVAVEDAPKAASEAAATAAPTKTKSPVRTVHKERRAREARLDDAAREAYWGRYWGRGFPRGGAMPYRFGSPDWASSW